MTSAAWGKAVLAATTVTCRERRILVDRGCHTGTVKTASVGHQATLPGPCRVARVPAKCTLSASVARSGLLPARAGAVGLFYRVRAHRGRQGECRSDARSALRQPGLRFAAGVLAAQARRDLREALGRAVGEGFSHVILDGKIRPADRCMEKAISVKGEVIDLWYSGKARTRGATFRP